MLSLQDIAAVKISIQICNSIELKKDVFRAWGSVVKPENSRTEMPDRKREWEEAVEKNATIMLRSVGLPEKLQENVGTFVLPIAMRMRYWAAYLEKTIQCSPEHCINYLNSSLFTSQGSIDTKKAAETFLMRDKTFNIKQRFTLACLYCVPDCISALYSQMTKEDVKEFYDAEKPERIQKPELVKFWSYYLMGDIDKLKGEKDLSQYRLEKAIENGSKIAVEHCLDKINLRKEYGIADAAVLAMRNWTMTSRFDWMIFLGRVLADDQLKWLPSDYYVDIVSFLLSKMREEQKIEFLKKDIEGVNYVSDMLEDHRQSRVLECFLIWPYQGYFTKMANLMWDFLPERNYAVLLLKICEKIETANRELNLKYCDRETYDYRRLLKEFWCQSPEHYKKYVISNQVVSFREASRTGTCVGLLTKLLTLSNFTSEDKKNIRLILATATDEEKDTIISSSEWKHNCSKQIKNEKWEVLDRMVNSFLSKEEANKFKRKLSYAKEAQSVCIDLVKNYKWNTVERFINWCALPIEEVSNLKKEIIYSEKGKLACVDFISSDKNLKAIDTFVRWCLPFEGEVKAFKRELILSKEGVCKCAELVKSDQLQLVTEFINYVFSSEEEIREFKKYFAYWRRGSVCYDLISDYSEDDIKFDGGKWEQLENFLTWSFSSKEEISEFKKGLFEV